MAATSALAARAGIAVFATGGLGGVHRGARETWDESADLATLAVTPITVVCAGVKSILDVGRTLERLETLNVTVLGYGTDAFPGFYLTDSGHPVAVAGGLAGRGRRGHARARRRSASTARRSWSPTRCRRAEQLDPALHDRVLAAAREAAATAGVTGKDVTPFLLDFFHRETGGASLEVNVRIVLRNARLAAEIAAAAA